MRPKELLHLCQLLFRKSVTRDTHKRAAQKEPGTGFQLSPQLLHDLAKTHIDGEREHESIILPFDLDLILAHLTPSLIPCILRHAVQPEGSL